MFRDSRENKYNAEQEPTMSRPRKKERPPRFIDRWWYLLPRPCQGTRRRVERRLPCTSLWVHTRKKHTLYKGREKGAPLRWACSIGRYQWEKWNGKPAGEESSVMRCRPQIGSYYVYLRVAGKTVFSVPFLCKGIRCGYWCEFFLLDGIGFYFVFLVLIFIMWTVWFDGSCALWSLLNITV